MKTLLFFILSLFTVLGLCAAPRTSVVHFGSDDGLSQSTVSAIYRDSKGFMWFGTWNGINRFDGYKFTPYTSESVLQQNFLSSRVEQILEDKQGYLWILAYDGAAWRFDRRHEVFERFPHVDYMSNSGGERRVQSIFITQSGNVWLTTKSNGCVRFFYDEKGGLQADFLPEQQNPAHSLKNGSMNFVFEDTERNTWVSTAGGLSYFVGDNGTLRREESIGRQLTPFFQDVVATDMLEYESDIWISSSAGDLLKYNKPTKTIKKLLNVGRGISINKLLRLKDDRLLLLTNHGFYMLDIDTDKLTAYNRSGNPSLPGDNILSGYVDKSGLVWLDIDCDGVACFNPRYGSIKYHRVEVDNFNQNMLRPNFFVVENSSGNVWVHPRWGGFSYYNRSTDKLEPFYDAKQYPNLKIANVLHCAMVDSVGTLWVGSYSKGLDKITIVPNTIKLVQPNPSTQGIASNDVRALFEDSNGNRYVSTKDGILYLYNSKFEKLGHLQVDGSFGNGKPLLLWVYSIMQDKAGSLWLSSKGKGLIRAHRVGSSIGLRLQLTYYGIAEGLTHNFVYHATEDSMGRIWVATFGGGINMLEVEGGKYKVYTPQNGLTSYPAHHDRVRHLYIDSAQYLWAATAEGVLVFDTQQPLNNIAYSDYMVGDHNLNASDVHYIYCDTKSRIWLGTFGGGVCLAEVKSRKPMQVYFTPYTESKGLSSNIVYSILQDNSDELWLATENGLTRFAPDAGSIIKVDESNGLTDMDFSEAACFKLQSGELMFGCHSGFYYFHPSLVSQSHYVPSLMFTNFRLFNQDVHPGKNSPLKIAISEADAITLESHQNTFSIDYAALDYKALDKVQYAYILEGFDKEWISAYGQRRATYTNMSGGAYTFRVKSTNSSGEWMNNERSIKIKIKPVFWITPLAFVLYTLLLALVVLAVVRIYSTIYRYKRQAKLEKEMSDLKLRFFTNVSHELRTPLTLISGPVEKMLHDDHLSKGLREQLQLVQNNTSKLTSLVNRLLDLRKVQDKKMRLNLEYTNVSQFVGKACLKFNKLAQEQNISFVVHVDEPDIMLWIDHDKLETILDNLISNAFKYTPQGKRIMVLLTQKDSVVELSVKDEGIGIERDNVPHVFDRFTTFSDTKSERFKGTGIGLALTKELIELHGATIGVRSEPERGTMFTVRFKKGKEHFNAANVDFIYSDNKIATTLDATTASKNDDGKPCILVAEDDDELRAFLVSVLSSNFSVEAVENGRLAWEKASAAPPDLLVSDIMMPEMDGITLTNKMKNDVATSHVPIILLTAKTTLDSKIEGLRYGADDYITKPFSTAYLEARILNLLEQRKRLQNRIVGNISRQHQATVEAENIPTQDDLFLKKLTLVLEENISNTDFTVEQLVAGVGLNRPLVFSKLKSLTGLAPVEFIREVRMKRAAHLLQQGGVSVAEAAASVGFADYRYFSKCFKQQFGSTPSEYSQRRGK